MAALAVLASSQWISTRPAPDNSSATGVSARAAAIPRRLGYRLDRIEAHEREAPGERGRRMIWVWDRGEAPAAGWSTGPAGRSARSGAG